MRFEVRSLFRGASGSDVRVTLADYGKNSLGFHRIPRSDQTVPAQIADSATLPPKVQHPTPQHQH